MTSPPLPYAAAAGGHPIHAMLIHFPIASFTFALFTDLAYWQTANNMWTNFSAWLLFAGLVFGGLAAVAGMLDFVLRRSVRRQGLVWPHALGNVVVLALALVNSFVHAADGWISVVPYGLALSASTVLLMIVTAWLGRSVANRLEAGIA
jgi:uncharacterized membrane protein